MPVERREDGSVSIKTKNGATAIGRVVEVFVNRDEERYQQWVEDCARLVTPCTHTINETEQYFLEQCDAMPLEANDIHMNRFKYSIIMNHCKDKLEHQPSEFSFDMTAEEIEKWHEENIAMRKEISNSSHEDFGLVIRGYYLPHTERNKVFYEEAYLETQKMLERTNHEPYQIEIPDICFFFEETTEVFEASGGGKYLMDQLIAFRGVSPDDIEKRDPRFLGYISTLRDIGKLPDFREK